MFDLVDDGLINCYRGRCTLRFDGRCWQWDSNSAVRLQYDLGLLLTDALTGRSTEDLDSVLEQAVRGNLAITIAWLQE